VIVTGTEAVTPIDELALKVSVELCPLTMLAGLNVAVTPVGKPDAASVIGCADPAAVAVDTVTVPVPPASTLRLLGERVTVKSLFGAVTLMVTISVCDSFPTLPVTVA
jgi:hypothetical protein